MPGAGVTPSSICVRYFGTYEWGQLRPGDVVPFPDGLHTGLHSKGNRRKPAFLLALQHVDAFLRVCCSMPPSAQLILCFWLSHLMSLPLSQAPGSVCCGLPCFCA